MRYLITVLFLGSCLLGQFNLEPKITTIDGETAYYYNSEQMDSLIVKFAKIKLLKEELETSNELNHVLKLRVIGRDSLLVLKTDYNNMVEEQYKDCLKLGKNRFWDSRFFGYIIGAATAYLSVELASKLN